jgi:hypothetical protein
VWYYGEQTRTNTREDRDREEKANQWNYHLDTSLSAPVSQFSSTTGVTSPFHASTRNMGVSVIAGGREEL